MYATSIDELTTLEIMNMKFYANFMLYEILFIKIKQAVFIKCAF